MAGGGLPNLRDGASAGVDQAPVPAPAPPASTHVEDELFLDDGPPIFVTRHHAASDAGGDGTFAVLAPPLFEEQARTRKVLVNLARDLADAGIDAVRFDYPGTGLSEGASDELTLAAAAAAFDRAIGYCQRLGAARIHLFGFRLGGYLALSALPRLPAARAVVWEPILDLAGYRDELVRLERATQRLADGEPVGIDGNPVGAALLAELATAPAIDLAQLAPLRDRITLLCWDGRAIQDAAIRAGLAATVVPDVRFSWRHIRVLEPSSPALFRATIQAVKGA